MRNLIRVALLTGFGIGSTLVGGATGTASADNIVCFIHAIEPWKTDHNSIAPINFGFKVHCTGKPALRNVTTKLWRYDPTDGKHYVHSERNDNTTDPDVETLYSASCSSAGILYQFHTEAIVNAFNGNWDREPDNSSTIAAIC
ncbi:hypothetical protein OG874_37620 [Nocardia sp. NBC_00565]|uniref:hypothetical protein n=1 Tax=Nocardia sp. NBC_00565 TaxID=2975993 RepID=UPI002E80EC42|nr:hypothetical protein [Nocardia sp. NBC_00565]WUC02386.1 hypothetical protein OG874_37620 [Nocardia sp. NBC_00565]